MVIPKEARVIMVRHAKSQFNKVWPGDVFDPVTKAKIYTQEHHRIAVDPSFIDCSLCDEGIEQCISAAPQLHSVRDITTVFVSPMRRTLQTASLLFRDHPDRSKIRFIAKPLLRENLCCSCDIPHHTFQTVAEEFKDHFPNLDTSTHINPAEQHWYLKDLQAEVQKSIHEQLKVKRDHSVHKEFLSIISNQFKKVIISNQINKNHISDDQFPKRVEDQQNTHIRAQKIKSFIREWLSIQPTGRTILVGHCTIFRFLTATKWETLDNGQPNLGKDPLECVKLENCEFLPLDKFL